MVALSNVVSIGLSARRMSTLIKASPTVQRMIRERGLEGVSINGSGPKGTITGSDVKLAAATKAEADASQQQRQAAQRAEAVPPVSYAEVAAPDERFACPGCSTLTALRVSRGFSDEGNGLAGVLAVPLFIVACLIFGFTICSMLRVLRKEFQPKRRLRKPRNDVELGEIVFDGRGCTKLHGEGPMPRESPWGGRRPAQHEYGGYEEVALAPCSQCSLIQDHGLHTHTYGTPARASPFHSELLGGSWSSSWNQPPII